jgi:hypothetical protein
MNRNQENKLGMYLAVELVMNEYVTLWSQVPIMSDLMAEFEGLIGQIEFTRIVQERGTAGVTLDKAEARHNAAVKGLKIADALVILATRNGNHSLAERMKFSPSSFENCRDTAAASKLQAIHQDAQLNSVQLVGFGITALMLTEFHGLMIAFRNSVAAPRTEIGKGVFSTENLAELYSQTDLFLKDQLDRVMESYRESAAVFFGRYESARVIVDSRGGGGADGNTGDLPPVE